MTIRHIVISSFAGFTVFTALIGYSGQRTQKMLYPVAAEPSPLPDSPSSTLKYPIKEHSGDHVTDKPKDPFYLPDPSNIKKDVEYDPNNRQSMLLPKKWAIKM
jgi:hypothetical protein